MRSVIDILELLEATGSRLEKEEILNANHKNDLLKQMFTAALDPYTVYYVNKFKMPAEDLRRYPDADDDVLATFLLGIDTKLASRKVTGNAAKDWVNNQFSLMTRRQQKWCQRILLKNLRCGVQESTVNKTWKDLVKSFAVQLAETLKTSHDPNQGIQILQNISYPIRVEPKLDGLRCIAVKHNNVVTMYTRNGTVLETLPRIKAALEAAPYDDVVLDGEAMGSDWNESASIVMSSKTKKDDENIVYNVFDCVLFPDWVSQENNEMYVERLNRLENVIECVNNKHVKTVPGETVRNQQELLTFYAGTMEHEFEGIMLKNLQAPYKFKRSDAIMKMKPVVTYEGVIVGSYEGRRGTKREGLFGGFDVVLPNGVITRIGGGFSDKQKALIQVEGPSSYEGKIVEIEGQPDPLTIDGLTKDGKIRFPVFIRYRDQSDVDPKVMQAYETWKSSEIK